MLQPDYVLLYVGDPLKSGAFYTDLLGVKPVETGPTFVMFVLPGLKLGLWQRGDVQPPVESAAGATELCISCPDNATVSQIHELWLARGINIIQQPTNLDFGFTFTAVDPDGHRIRIFAPRA